MESIGIFISVVPVLVIVVSLVIWVPMLIHAVKTNIPNKELWLMILIFGGLIGAIVYYFTVYTKHK